VGSICRVMQTMGFHRLHLVNPAPLADPSHPNAIKMAVGSHAILKQARIFSSIQDAISGFSPVYAATARAKRGPVLTPRQTAIELCKSDKNNFALIFGSEADGLTKKELLYADRLIRIPMAGSQPSLNLSHAVMIVLYELLMEVYTTH
jgi:TrmH family RNA methyltransferase